jgi:hypothetical protein
MLKNKGFIEKNSILVKEFDRYIIEHPEFAEKIPNNALIVMQVEDNEEFNQWAKETALKIVEKEQAIVIFSSIGKFLTAFFILFKPVSEIVLNILTLLVPLVVISYYTVIFH